MHPCKEQAGGGGTVLSMRDTLTNVSDLQGAYGRQMNRNVGMVERACQQFGPGVNAFTVPCSLCDRNMYQRSLCSLSPAVDLMCDNWRILLISVM